MMSPIFSLGTKKLTTDDRLAELFDLPAVGDLLRVVDNHDFALARQNLVGHVRRRRHQFELAVAFQALLNDLAVEHAQKAAAEAEAQPLAILGLIGEAGIVELQLAERLAQLSKSLLLIGYRPEKTIGLGSL